MHTSLRLLAVLAAVGLSSACGISYDSGDTESSASATPSPTTPASGSAAPGAPESSPAVSPTSTSSTTQGAAVPEGLREEPRVSAAIADTATREDVDPAQVVVAAWSQVTWSDGSLGCPQPGMSYTQATVDGELLILRVGAGLYQYHARTGGPFTYCAEPSAGYAVG
jgi:hypothetical protein